MSPTEVNHWSELSRTGITTPEMDTVTIKQIAPDPDATAKVTAIAKNLMSSVNAIGQLVRVDAALTAWEKTLATAYARLERLRRGMDTFETDVTNERLFKLAPFFTGFRWLVGVLVVAGVGLMANTISATITGSAEIPSLVDSPVRAGLWAFIPVCFMLAGHIMHNLARRDAVKRTISWMLLGMVVTCAMAWAAIYVFAFPQDGTARAVGNVFDATATGARNYHLMGLIAMQLLGEMAFGAAVGIELQRLATRGYTKTVTPSAEHGQLDAEQRDLVQEIANAARLRGMIEDYSRKYAAAEAVYVQRCLAFLAQTHLQITVARDTATLSVTSN
jgi:hypothetical protein